MSLTLTDLFCGAGGSSTGAIQIPGVEVKVASNHWQLAVDTHNTNHQNAMHICADISQIDPAYFPKTDLAWMSPSCTFHSPARGKKLDALQGGLFGDKLPDEAAERSRATMWDVVRFTEYHQYQAVIVENVVEVASWLPFRAWLLAMNSLGYDHQVVSLNSMHAQAEGLPAAQSRDRLYMVFHRKGNRRPDLLSMQRPKAFCPTCDQVVASVQSWKRPDNNGVGRYRSQYVYRCPNARCRNQVVEPGWLPASSIIDWTLRGHRIGDRAKPMADKTRRRIAAGIARYWAPIHLEAAGNTYDAADPKHAQYGNPNSYYRAWPVDEPLKALHTTLSKALAIPVEGRDGKVGKPVSEALRTQTTRLETALVTPCGGTWNDRATSSDEVMRTQTSRESYSIGFPPFIAELRGGGSTARPVKDPLATVTAGGGHHALITSYYGSNDGAQPVSDALPTVTTTDRHALIMRGYGGTEAHQCTPASEPTRTLTGSGSQFFLTPGDIEAAEAQVDDVLFRMLEPSECKGAMAFPGTYVILGNRREQVRLCGNAVTPPAARDLMAAVIASLTGETT